MIVHVFVLILTFIGALPGSQEVSVNVQAKPYPSAEACQTAAKAVADHLNADKPDGMLGASVGCVAVDLNVPTWPQPQPSSQPTVSKRP